MNNLLNQPGFAAYGFTCLVLCANLLFLWVYSGAVRNRTKEMLNPEDVATFGGQLVPADPPAVSRVLRAHTNAQSAIYPFLVIGALMLAAGASSGTITIYCSIFCVARWLHSLTYLAGKQPWRTVGFLTGLLTTGVMMLHLAWLLLRAG